MKIRRLLIANRGEIAVRVIRTCRELGITSIALFSEPDRAALHVLLADEAYPIGPGPSRESYLDLGSADRRRRSAARRRDPSGLRLLRRERAFARACEAVGIVFVGPAPATIDALGDKLARAPRARAASRWCQARLARSIRSRRRDAAKTIGWPLMLKAARRRRRQGHARCVAKPSSRARGS
jgi:acetyl-CoA carboxylase biotin carboxylase subunit